MKRFALALAILSVLSVSAFGQSTEKKADLPEQAKHGKKNFGKVQDQIWIKLNLNAKQMVAIKDLDEETRAKVKGLSKAQKGVPKDNEYKALVKKVRQDHLGKLKGILTPEQFETYEKEMKTARKEGHQGHAKKDKKASPLG